MEYTHDTMFKRALSDPKQAKSLLESYLPVEITKLIDLDSIGLVKDSFVTKDLKQYFADLLFSIKLQSSQDAYLYILFEHKSYKDEGVLLQLLGYMIKIWKAHLSKSLTPYLPSIIPVVVYHGKTRWEIPKSFGDMFENLGELDRYVPDFEAQNVNLRTMSDKELKGVASLKLCMWTLKHIFDEDPLESIYSIKKLFLKLLDNKSHIEYIDLSISYVARVKKLSKEEVLEKLRNVLRLEDEKMELISEQFRKEGIQQGVQQGMQKERTKLLELAKKLRKEGRSLEDLEKYLEAKNTKNSL